ncbi:uncharacterized protein LY89DRAFT_681289 [Mollisia scopiformis]|uniref:Secreted protein n=1 Tax=Mollisia scopiformis TaxID=149040 RepID=A0A194XPD1_MOLSC|nr:uncharacterized protein LY89DRAFT_681289 [Mollisia scopiformis]KUJ21929.1 hypothetical protein LY89DRAFT_681289 [Mollisia scopiformis]
MHPKISFFPKLAASSSLLLLPIFAVPSIPIRGARNAYPTRLISFTKGNPGYRIAHSEGHALGTSSPFSHSA